MFRIPRKSPWPPAIDLGTVRETVAYMHDDMSRVPGLEKVAAALSTVLDEIASAEKNGKSASIVPISYARFLPKRS